MPDRKILWKSDLWFGTVTFGALTLFCLAYLALHLARGETGEAFTMGLVAAIPAILTLFCAFTDRSKAMTPEAYAKAEDEYLAERVARLKDPGRPPPIG